ncbi:MAG: bifunctional UDP-3-O-[Bacteroidetes bacterium]|nr:bifunctional UDP-3-O-[3-hydroxymyristoyl] N-acetylglucosamine deacetylase/3-hydroxyacyl-ACP dehydratase [Bacteroidota bacterium]
MEKQTTIAKPVSISGIGLHTGNESTITFKPAPANTHYVFVRTDLEERVEIPALTEYVVDISRGTTLGIGNVEVHTVEHVLAALVGLEIDNCIIELTNNEPPVKDGSSKAFVDALLSVGIVELDAERKYFELKDQVYFKNEEKQVDIVGLPLDTYRITVMVDYFNDALGSQHSGLFDLKKEFIKEFSSARTFCFLSEVEMLSKAGLIKGGSCDSAVVIIDKEITEDIKQRLKSIFNIEVKDNVSTGILNGHELRFKNEPARHKLLDMLGDLSLVGVPLKMQVLAARPGHASNFEFAKLVRKQYLKKIKEEKRNPIHTTPVLDIYKILDIIPHRFPFLLVDKIIHFDMDEKRIIGIKNVTVNEPFFQGHFPGKPIMPGVLLCEAMAQVGGLYLWNCIEPNTKLMYFTGMKNVRFKQPVVPGDQLVIDINIISNKFGLYVYKGTIFVDGKVVAEAEFSAALVDR